MRDRSREREREREMQGSEGGNGNFNTLDRMQWIMKQNMAVAYQISQRY
jgi:hypothetical protein